MRNAVLVALVLLASSSAAASWFGPGTFEPDTRHDVGRMWSEPYREPAGERVYFNAFQAAPGTSANPNVGALGSRLLPAPAANHRAILGFWKDCNADGYVGQAESAIQDYRAELLSGGAAICPAGSLHNDGQWVSELISIGQVDPCEYESDAVRADQCGNMLKFAANERVVYDVGAYVWGDQGAPGSVPTLECAVAPMPRGTTSSTGALLGYADCQSRRGIARGVNEADRLTGLGVGFEDPADPASSSSLLNQPAPVSLFGNGTRSGALQADAPERSATVWDCQGPATTVDDPTGLVPEELAIADPTGGRLSADRFPFVIVHALTGVGFEEGVLRVPLVAGGRLATLPGLAPSVAPEGSSWDALEHAADGPAGDCSSATASPLRAAYVGALVEGGPAPLREARKDRSSFVFTFYDGHRGFHPDVDPILGPTAPSDGGLFYGDHNRTGDGPMWSAIAETQQDPQVLDRSTLQPSGGLYFTYYASVGSATTSTGALLPTQTAYVYGADNCQGQTTGERNGWVCDASLWWKDALGHDARPRYARGEPIARVPGDVYHLRDVDCYDGTLLSGTNARASLADASADGPCQGP